MNQNHPEPPTLHRISQRLAESRYFTFSLLLHVAILVIAGTIVMVQQKEDDFVPVGVDVSSIDPNPNTDLTPDTTQPKETVNNTPRPPETPKVVTPPSEPGESGLIVIETLKSNSTKISFPGIDTPTIPREPSTPLLPKQPTSEDYSLRGTKDSRNHIDTKNWPQGRPRPTDVSEEAVLRGLRWLRDHQNEDGSWGDRNKSAMTGLAVLCFLGHGETRESKDFGFAVSKSVEWLIDMGTKYQGRLSMTSDGWGPGNSGVYEHAIGTYALGEYYSMTKDERVLELLRQAVAFIVAGQGPDGGWMYHYDKTASDTSVTGWQVQALKAAHLTQLNFPGVNAALDNAMKNFDRVQGPNGGYGYRGPEDRYSLTGVGVLSELFWRGTRNKDLRHSVEFIHDKSEKEFPVRYQGEKGDLYSWYYTTQAMLMYGGAAWTNWEKRFSPEIIQAQTTAGDWPAMRAPGVGNLQDAPHLTGQVYRTTLSVLMLEVYYRYMPVHRSETAREILKMAAR